MELENIIKAEVAKFNQALVNEELAAELLENYLRPNQLLNIFIERLPFVEFISCKPLKEKCDFETDSTKCNYRADLTKSLHLIETQRGFNYSKGEHDFDYRIQDVQILKVKFKDETYLIYGGMRWKFACHSENIGYDPDHDFDIGNMNLEILSIMSLSELQRKISETPIEDLGILTAINNYQLF